MIIVIRCVVCRRTDPRLQLLVSRDLGIYVGLEQSLLMGCVFEVWTW